MLPVWEQNVWNCRVPLTHINRAHGPALFGILFLVSNESKQALLSGLRSMEVERRLFKLFQMYQKSFASEWVNLTES